MKDPQQEVDELIEKYRIVMPKYAKDWVLNDSIKCALTDNQNTIDTLEKVRNKNGKRLIFCVALVDEVAHHNQVGTILKSRLK